MEALEVGHLGLVAGLDQGLEARLDEGAGAAAEDGLLAEEVGLGLLLEGGLEHAGAGGADALGPGERGLLGLLGLVLRDGDERRHALALGVEAADHVAGALGRDHDDVDVLVRLDQPEVDGEAVAEHERLALGEVRADVRGIDRGLLHVRQADHDDVGAADGLGGVIDLEAVLLGDGAGLRARVEADDDLAAALLQVDRMGVALRTVAEDGEGLVLEHAEVGVFVGVDFGGHGRWSCRVGG